MKIIINGSGVIISNRCNRVVSLLTEREYYEIRWYRGNLFVLWCYLIFLLKEDIMRKFERINKEVFIRDIPDGTYEDIVLPKRSTKYSAGYDFYSVTDFMLNPRERKVIPTGIKCCMEDNE